jgi:hypothetical protein
LDAPQLARIDLQTKGGIVKRDPVKLQAFKELRQQVERNRGEARQARSQSEWDRCWGLLEDAHVLSQPWVSLHIRVHASMLSAAITQRSRSEITGQLVRLIAAGPASATRYPTGNSGRASVPATQPMPIRADLAVMLERAGKPHD